MNDKEFVLEWLRYAENDLISARILFENSRPRQTETSAWHCQQCAEKSLKAFLVAHDIEPPKIHNLEDLINLCKNINGGFSQVEPDCKRINPYGVASRYPREIAIDETITKTLIERAQKIYDFCVETINALFQEQEKEKK